MVNQEYEVKGLDDNFHKNNFMLKYKKYIDVQTLKDNKELFLKVLSNVEEEIKKIGNLQKNTLFICNDNISKYVFLEALSTLPRLVSERSVNLIDLVDVWYGNGRSTNIRKDDEETIYSEQDIREDVVCVYADKAMFAGKTYAGILNSFLSSRSDRLNIRHEPLYTWVFYRGTIGYMRTEEIAKQTYEFFNADPVHYQIVNLSKFDNILSGKVRQTYSSSFVQPTQSSINVHVDSGKGGLDDMY